MLKSAPNLLFLSVQSFDPAQIPFVISHLLGHQVRGQERQSIPEWLVLPVEGSIQNLHCLHPNDNIEEALDGVVLVLGELFDAVDDSFGSDGVIATVESVPGHRVVVDLEGNCVLLGSRGCRGFELEDGHCWVVQSGEVDPKWPSSDILSYYQDRCWSFSSLVWRRACGVWRGWRDRAC